MPSYNNIACDALYAVEKQIPELIPVGKGWSFADSQEMHYRKVAGLRARYKAAKCLIKLGLDEETAIAETNAYPVAHANKMVARIARKYNLGEGY